MAEVETEAEAATVAMLVVGSLCASIGMELRVFFFFFDDLTTLSTGFATACFLCDFLAVVLAGATVVDDADALMIDRVTAQASRNEPPCCCWCAIAAR